MRFGADTLSILIFTQDPTWPETRLVVRAAKAREIPLHYIATWDLSMPNMSKISADIVYVPNNMLNRFSTFEFMHRVLILQELERQIGTVINPVESMILYSKEHLTIQMARLDIPHPRTLITENVTQAYEFAADLLDSGRNVVLKPLCRGLGIGVIRLDRIRSRHDLLQFLVWYNRAHANGVFYLQEFVPNHGYDVRCFVIDGEVVGREKRSNPEDFRYNISAGGKAETFNDPIYDEISIKVAEAVGFKIAGIDVLPGADGTPYVLEANCFPGFKALIEATNIPIHEKIVDYFQRLMRS